MCIYIMCVYIYIYIIHTIMYVHLCGPQGLFVGPPGPTNRPFENKHITCHRLCWANQAS